MRQTSMAANNQPAPGGVAGGAVDCFREGPNILVIDPDECIDCTLCVAECPVEAIFAEDDVPDAQREFIQLNAGFDTIPMEEAASTMVSVTTTWKPPGA